MHRHAFMKCVALQKWWICPKNVPVLRQEFLCSASFCSTTCKMWTLTALQGVFWSSQHSTTLALLSQSTAASRHRASAALGKAAALLGTPLPAEGLGMLLPWEWQAVRRDAAPGTNNSSCQSLPSALPEKGSWANFQVISKAEEKADNQCLVSVTGFPRE